MLMTKRKESSMLEGKFQIQSDESIKLIRGQRGSYGWEIKVSEVKVDLWTVERLKELNKALSEAFAIDEDKDKEAKDAVSKEGN